MCLFSSTPRRGTLFVTGNISSRARVARVSTGVAGEPLRSCEPRATSGNASLARTCCKLLLSAQVHALLQRSAPDLRRTGGLLMKRDVRTTVPLCLLAASATATAQNAPPDQTAPAPQQSGRSPWPTAHPQEP